MVNESKNNDEMFSKIKHPEDDGDFKGKAKIYNRILSNIIL